MHETLALGSSQKLSASLRVPVPEVSNTVTRSTSSWPSGLAKAKMRSLARSCLYGDRETGIGGDGIIRFVHNHGDHRGWSLFVEVDELVYQTQNRSTPKYSGSRFPSR